MGPVRFLIPNLVQLAGATIVPSSASAGFGTAALLRASVTDPFRTKPGWTVYAGVNDVILFDLFAATIAAGYYATAAAYGEAVRQALEVANGAPVWAVSYNGGTHVFTISADVAFVLKFGVSSAASAHPDLGFAGVTTGSALSHTAGSAAYQSRHWLTIDLGAAYPFAYAIILGHNVSTAGAGFVAFQAHSSDLSSFGLRDFSTDLTAALTGNAAMMSATFASTTKRYLRLIIEDVQNPAGYAELGLFLVSTYGQPSVNPSIDYAEESEHLSELLYADDGALHRIPRTRRRVYFLLWQIDPRTAGAAADLALFEALDALGIGDPIVVVLDTDDPTAIVYGFLRQGLRKQWTAGTYWAVPIELAQAL